MLNNIKSSQRSARSSIASEVASEDLSRFEGEPQIPAQPAADTSSPLSWKAIVARYQKSSAKRGIWQIVNTLVPYVALWYLMYLTAPISWWLTIPLAVLAGGFLVRTFIISHDCGHGSFFKSPRANHVVGAITSFLAF